MIATDESIRVSSSIAIAYDSVSVPPPPYSSGIVMPISPSSAMLGDELVREPLLAVELLCDRRDPLECELANRVAYQLVFALDVEVHAAALSSARIGGRWYRGGGGDVSKPPSVA